MISLEWNKGKVVVDIEIGTLDEKVIYFVINSRTCSRSDWNSNHELLKCSSETSPLSKPASLYPRLNSFRYQVKNLFHFAIKINVIICLLPNKDLRVVYCIYIHLLLTNKLCHLTHVSSVPSATSMKVVSHVTSKTLTKSNWRLSDVIAS